MTTQKPVLIELDDTSMADPALAAPVPDTDPLQTGRAMTGAMALGGGRMSRLAKAGWAAFSGLIVLALSVSAYDFVAGLLTRTPALGYVAGGMVGVATLAALAFVLAEVRGIRRLRQTEGLRQRADAALASADRAAALQVAQALIKHYAGRPDMVWARDRLKDGLNDQPDADGVLGQCETVLMAQLDARARTQIEASARQVALLTAMLPLPLIDVIAALVTNLRMIRRVAEVYGGRAGTLGSLRLLRGVIAHLLATGAVAVGEDMLSSVASGGVVSKVSRRFGEGVVNAALTARLGIAAMDVCRPLPYRLLPRPRTSNVMGRAVSGLFDRSNGDAPRP